MALLRKAGRLSALAVLVAAAPLSAQVQAGQWQVSPYGSAIRFDETSAIKDGPAAGIHAVYFINRYLAVGPSFLFSRTASDGEFFPAFQWNLGTDTSRVLHPGQKLSIAVFSGRAEVHLPAGRLSPYASAGAGWYSVYLDPQAAGDPHWFTHLMFEFGGGLDITLGSQTGVRLEVRDLLFTDYDRNSLDLVEERFESELFSRPNPPPPKERIHNLSFALGFTYVP
ncbi:MAG TPA: outer membrane beta-barrel protein [Longimicrobiales bacterium]